MKTIKEYDQFINEEYKIDDITDYKIYIMDNNIEQLININKEKNKIDSNSVEFDNLKEKWNDLIIKIKNYYTKILKTIFDIHGVSMTREMFYKIKDYLTKNEEYDNATQVIMFDLSSFTRNLIKENDKN